MPPFARASELDRLFDCAGSATLPREKDKGSISAAWGTHCHTWCETGVVPEGQYKAALEKKIKDSGIYREVLWPVEGEHEVSLALNVVTGAVARYLPPPAFLPGVTPKAHASAWKEGFDDQWCTGSLDYAMELAESWWVDDLKTGRFAHWKDYEAQQLFYCLAYSKWRYGEVRSGRSTITHWTRYPMDGKPERKGTVLSKDYVETFYTRLQELRSIILKNRLDTSTLVLYTGNQCTFCPSKGNCPELKKKENNYD